jgi:hypothetical protein
VTSLAEPRQAAGGPGHWRGRAVTRRLPGTLSGPAALAARLPVAAAPGTPGPGRDAVTVVTVLVICLSRGRPAASQAEHGPAVTVIPSLSIAAAAAAAQPPGRGRPRAPAHGGASLSERPMPQRHPSPGDDHHRSLGPGPPGRDRDPGPTVSRCHADGATVRQRICGFSLASSAAAGESPARSLTQARCHGYPGVGPPPPELRVEVRDSGPA